MIILGLSFSLSLVFLSWRIRSDIIALKTVFHTMTALKQAIQGCHKVASGVNKQKEDDLFRMQLGLEALRTKH